MCKNGRLGPGGQAQASDSAQLRRLRVQKRPFAEPTAHESLWPHAQAALPRSMGCCVNNAMRYNKCTRQEVPRAEARRAEGPSPMTLRQPPKVERCQFSAGYACAWSGRRGRTRVCSRTSLLARGVFAPCWRVTPKGACDGGQIFSLYLGKRYRGTSR